MNEIKRTEETTFAPCHVTAFFVPRIQPREPERTGSWGAGVCLGTGVVATVQVEEADTSKIQVRREGRAGDQDARTTNEALRVLLEAHAPGPLRVSCQVHEGAPLGQGFGVSGASALSSAFALARCLGVGRSDALRAAHLAEIRNRSGLSDVAASFLGGSVLRTAPGLPPYGSTQRLPSKGNVVVAVTGPELDTGTLLRDEEVLERVTEEGRSCLGAVGEHPSLEVVFEQGAAFARATNLVSDQTLQAVEACREGGRGMVAMLGNTVVAYGDTERLESVLSGFGDPFVVPIDQGGLRLFDRDRLDQLA